MTGNEANIRANAMHLRLDNLWRSARGIDYTDATVNLDLDTWRDIRSSGAANSDGSIQFCGCGQDDRWRGMKVTFRFAMSPASYVEDAKPTDCAPRAPFCMYIDAVKRNGRHVYIDDPSTDEAFR